MHGSAWREDARSFTPVVRLPSFLMICLVPAASVVSRGVVLGAWCLANISGSESTGISELTSENLPNQYTQYETRRRYFTTPTTLNNRPCHTLTLHSAEAVSSSGVAISVVASGLVREMVTVAYIESNGGIVSVMYSRSNSRKEKTGVHHAFFCFFVFFSHA